MVGCKTQRPTPTPPTPTPSTTVQAELDAGQSEKPVLMQTGCLEPLKVMCVPWYEMEFPDDLSSDKSTPRPCFCSLTYEEGLVDASFIEPEDDGPAY